MMYDKVKERTYLSVKAIVNQESTNWPSKQESHLVPGHHFESEVNRSVFPILIDEIG
jgi:hypothetical protein